MEKSLWIHLVLLAAPFCGILLNGYEYGTQDHEHYLPEIIHRLDPSYFPGDYLFDEPSGESTLWIPAMAYLCRWLPLEPICFTGYLAFQYLLFWAVYHLALNISRNRLAALFALLLALIPKEIGGSTLHTFETYFGVRSPAMALGLTSLLFLITERVRLAAVFCGLAFLIHPLIALPLVCGVVLQIIWRLAAKDFRAAWTSILLLVITTAPLVVGVAMSDHGIGAWGPFRAIDASYRSLLRFRTEYLFLSGWKIHETLEYLAYATVLVVLVVGRLRNSPNARDKKVSEVVVICVAAALGTFPLTEWWPVEAAFQLQPYRSWYLIYYLALIYAADLLVRCSLRLQKEHLAARQRSAVGTESASSFVAIVELLVLSVLLGMLLTSTLHGAAMALMLMLVPLLRQKARNWSRWALALLTIEILLISLVQLRGSEFYILSGTVAGALLYTVLAAFLRGNRRLNRPARRMAPLVIGSAGLLGLLVALYIQSSAGISGLGAVPGLQLTGRRWGMGVDEYLVDVGRWCQENTLKEAVFVVPPQSHSFRVHSLRSIVVDGKDGAKVMFSRDYAFDWLKLHARPERLSRHYRHAMPRARCRVRRHSHCDTQHLGAGLAEGLRERSVQRLPDHTPVTPAIRAGLGSPCVPLARPVY